MPAKLLIANRGEIAVRILRAAAELGMRTVAVFSQDDAESLHRRSADESCALAKAGAAAYLDIDAILRAAKDTGCDAIHPGYGFLSENADFARRCADANLTFVGPRPEVLALFSDKAEARALAERLGAADFFNALPATGAMLIKAIGGGGGRGMRVVQRREELKDAYARCQSEARAAFGNGDVYVEQFLPRARHVEVQIVGDGSGAVSHLGERDCSIQRRHQKLVEIAPAPGLPDGLRQRLATAATTLASSVRYDNIGTFEFLVDASTLSAGSPFAFIEANPRLQVEHTVTEEVYGVDLVAIQLELAGGRSLAALGLLQADVPAPRGVAIQARINMETMQADGAARPSSGTLSAFVPACGPGIRVDTFGYAGYTPSGRFDALLAKLIACHPSGRFEYAVSRLQRALAEFYVAGVAVNIPFLQRLVQHPAFRNAAFHTRFLDDHLAELVVPDDRASVAPASSSTPTEPVAAREQPSPPPVEPPEPKPAAQSPRRIDKPHGTVPVASPLQGTIVSVEVREGATVRTGQLLVVVESMKMEHEVHANVEGVVRRVVVDEGGVINAGEPLLFVEAAA
ncbi:Pyruvate carboxylase [Geodia barretti]|uniref:Pyruvate carboxylase n=1 Tax=Geodia barretti TaxID=519541 RepID=A0AA35QYJ4_GEOBA|nr:Pyruvate carboxylase [Geodia barretti]